MDRLLCQQSSFPFIGVDLDNTVIDYEKAICALAFQKGYISSPTPAGSYSKKALRDRIRSEGGDVEWQKMQALLYTTSLKDAEPYPGVLDFLGAAKRNGIRVSIVSHKTEHSPYDESRTSLRRAALSWLEARGFFDVARTGLAASDVFFESTRREKIDRIISLGCSAFIDDLIEVFEEDSFPEHVTKILFDPQRTGTGQETGMEDLKSFSSWMDLAGFFFPRQDEEWMIRELSALLECDVQDLQQLHGGRNSKVYRMVCPHPEGPFVVKRYYREASDSRDRLKVEFTSLNFLWDNGIRTIPRPVLSNPEKNYAVYQYIEGEHIAADSVTDSDITQAADFLALLKKLAQAEGSRALPDASEACFAVTDIFRNLQLRLCRLQEIDDPELRDFLNEDLLPVHRRIVGGAQAADSQALDFPITREERTLSPSDFGFHNALKDQNGTIHFLDFEYFGWDDPAKTVCDFVLHPAMNLAKDLRKVFFRKMLPVYHMSCRLEERLRIVYPLYVLKWCTILLNEFLPERLARRKFSFQNGVDERALKHEQLEKARRMLNRIEDGEFEYREE
jgi:hypothetical protein